MGSFIFHKNPAKAAVFLAGGIGITPFRSIVRQTAKEKLPHRLYLFDSNRRPEDARFLDELQDLSESNAHFVFIPSMTEMEKSKMSWHGERGFIDREILVKHFCDLNGPIYYVAGPPAMVAAMWGMLTKADISEDDIRIEHLADIEATRFDQLFHGPVGRKAICPKCSSEVTMMRGTRRPEEFAGFILRRIISDILFKGCAPHLE